jgi:hypothetical protein
MIEETHIQLAPCQIMFRITYSCIIFCIECIAAAYAALNLIGKHQIILHGKEEYVRDDATHLMV